MAEIALIGKIEQEWNSTIEILYSSAVDDVCLRIPKYYIKRRVELRDKEVALLITFDLSDTSEFLYKTLVEQHPPLFQTQREISIANALEHGERVLDTIEAEE
jgi:hypothetical protein|tara:strand:+ start:175 stop:483 length:309 start_codon:yes stop_codon:yes gene_type:complete